MICLSPIILGLALLVVAGVITYVASGKQHKK